MNKEEIKEILGKACLGVYCPMRWRCLPQCLHKPEEEVSCRDCQIEYLAHELYERLHPRGDDWADKYYKDPPLPEGLREAIDQIIRRHELRLNDISNTELTTGGYLNKQDISQGKASWEILSLLRSHGLYTKEEVEKIRQDSYEEGVALSYASSREEVEQAKKEAREEGRQEIIKRYATPVKNKEV